MQAPPTVCNSKLLMAGREEPQKEKPKSSPERLKQNTELTPAALKHWKPGGSTLKSAGKLCTRVLLLCGSRQGQALPARAAGERQQACPLPGLAGAKLQGRAPQEPAPLPPASEDGPGRQGGWKGRSL